jgi:hypothetical protein
MWTILAQLVIAYIVASAFMPSASVQKREAEKQKDIDFPQAEEGTPQAVIFGDCWSGDWTILSIGRYRTEAIEKSQDSGK